MHGEINRSSAFFFFFICRRHFLGVSSKEVAAKVIFIAQICTGLAYVTRVGGIQHEGVRLLEQMFHDLLMVFLN